MRGRASTCRRFKFPVRHPSIHPSSLSYLVQDPITGGTDFTPWKIMPVTHAL